MTAAALPPTFALPILDDAMAPMLLLGGSARFATGREPVAGRPVLVRDREGDAFIREYQPLPSGWAALATNGRYQTFESQRDGLVLLAVLTGYDLPVIDGYPPSAEP